MTDLSAHDQRDGERKLTGLLARVLGPVGPEVACEQCFELLDEYVDLELAGVSPDDRLPGMQAHLDGCPACHEDYESLRDFVADPRAQRPGEER